MHCKMLWIKVSTKCDFKNKSCMGKAASFALKARL